MFGSVISGFGNVILLLVVIGLVLGLFVAQAELFNPSKTAAEAARVRAQTEAQANRDAWTLEQERRRFAESEAEAEFRRRLVEQQIMPAVRDCATFIAFGLAVFFIARGLAPLAARTPRSRPPAAGGGPGPGSGPGTPGAGPAAFAGPGAPPPGTAGMTGPFPGHLPAATPGASAEPTTHYYLAPGPRRRR
jgi:hypothetical protein